MERNVVIICVILGFLGVTSAALAFVAETTRIKHSDVRLVHSTVRGVHYGVCKYPKSASYELGLVSTLLLLIAHIIINSATRCYCCATRQNLSSGNRTKGLITFVLSWATFLMAFPMLVAASTLSNISYNESNYEDRQYSYYISCTVIKPGVFAGAGILVLATVAMGIICHISLSSIKSTGPFQTQNPGIEMVHPHFPLQNNQPSPCAPPQQN